MENKLPEDIQKKVDEVAQKYESATQHVGLGPAIFKEGVEYAFACAKVMANKELSTLKAQQGGVTEDAHEKEVMMQAFDKVRQIFECRQWIMDGRGSYPYNDDRYKEEVRYLYDEFDAIQKDTWKNIKSKSVDYRQQIIREYLKANPNAYQELKEKVRIQEAAIELLAEKHISLKEKGDELAECLRFAVGGRVEPFRLQADKALAAWNGNGQKKEGEDE
jgi:hypothetical protein